ncbi:peroxisomal N(1)-acetyl-spermine/spermidine oxidase-like [Wyeomyia smithii]|uniref:peroxisomal N(1)-acetyl-spermine/spermidine oxidase-like n=1 Tax=Wyeomyia smithii TaxID=174621 RepID=UPI002467EB48|nr:peroxisomal N(1)-acetyl-spermine/spermidine oxidase-like [Wyeomyia smithii]
MSAKIVIIGAGSAGIAAATRLYQRGLKNVQILEATDRIGGRVHTVPFGENVIDKGAQWCHGEKQNVVFELASPLGLLESSIIGGNNLLIQSNGEIVNQALSDRLMQMAGEIAESEELETYGGTFGDFVTERFMKAVNEEKNKDIDRELVQQFLVSYHNYQKGYNAIDSWYEYSVNDDAEDCEGNQTLSWMGKGYQSVLDLLLGRHPSQNGDLIPIEEKIVFNKFVKNIHWNRGPDYPVTIYCQDGSQYDADHVILTMSLGVLKENLQTMFTPQLPSIKRNAITGIYFGTVNKIIMEFKVPFWAEVGNTFSLLWGQDELESLRASKYAWTEGVSAFFKIDRQPKLLAAWMMGKECRQAELLSGQDIIDGLLFLLRKFFKEKQIDPPIKMIRSQWFSDRNFRGSYSSRSIKTDLLQTGCNDLAIPLTDCFGKPVLLFAGEATNSKHYGTVHGAIETGWREANRLIDLYEKQQKKVETVQTT